MGADRQGQGGGGHLTPLEDCSSEEYYRRVLYIPYMDSIISSLAVRFRDDSTVPYGLLALHPHQMTSIDKATFILMAKRIEELYGFDNSTQESCTWYDLWKNRQTTKLPTESTGAGAADMDLAEVIQHATPTLFPAVNAALNQHWLYQRRRVLLRDRSVLCGE